MMSGDPPDRTQAQENRVRGVVHPASRVGHQMLESRHRIELPPLQQEVEENLCARLDVWFLFGMIAPMLWGTGFPRRSSLVLSVVERS
jgi:hypothetical protein